MIRQLPVTTIAGCYALAAFAVAIFAGLAGDRPASSIIATALLALLVCYLVGLAVGRAAETVIEERMASLAAATSEGASRGSEESVDNTNA